MSDGEKKQCPSCQGFGWVKFADGRQEQCQDCDGYGEVENLDGECEEKGEASHD